MTINLLNEALAGRRSCRFLPYQAVLQLVLLVAAGRANPTQIHKLKFPTPSDSEYGNGVEGSVGLAQNTEALALVVEKETGLPDVQAHLSSEKCKPLTRDYKMLVDRLLLPFKEPRTVEDIESMQRSPSATIYLKDNNMLVNVSEHNQGNLMIVTLLESIHRITTKVRLPDLVMVINGADEPAGILEPLFSFCRHPSSNNDLLIANAVEGALSNGLREDNFTPSRFGEEDGRKSAVIWYGRPHAWGRGQRHAVAKAGAKHPGIVHTGITDFSGLPDWYTKEHQEEFDEFKKDGMWILEWADHYKYQLNVAGNCGSSRLAYQLYTDTALFWVTMDDEEWYYPLLRPYVHYIPVEVTKDGESDLVAQRRWAEDNPKKVEQIVRQSTEFAVKHLIPEAGYDCYLPMLLHKYSQILTGVANMTIPDQARTFPFPE